MPTLKFEPPRYIVLKDSFVGGSFYNAGTVAAYGGWPTPYLQPQNSTAEKIAAYHMRWQAQPGFRGSPFHAAHGLYLPALLPRCAPPTPNAPIGSEILGLVAERDIDSLLPPPKYKMLKAHLVGRRELAAGEEFYFIGWPISELMAPCLTLRA
jgi:hypothetical protein